MTQPHRTPTRHSSTLTVIAIVLVLWMSWAFIFHQYQFSTNHHDEHHCQLFSCLQHGFNHPLITVSNNPSTHIFGLGQYYALYEQTVFSYLARSPPVNLI
ncbi:DUF2607 family protein [Vibrio tetraodonis]|uniref:DUF2607 family protein n=1 Tax=Vibrio tetraodonis TaxID=2231647 RepID=UPI000E0B35E8